jgi:hypothetical protein
MGLKKYKTQIYVAYKETYITGKDTHRLKVKRLKKDISHKWKPKANRKYLL